MPVPPRVQVLARLKVGLEDTRPRHRRQPGTERGNTAARSPPTFADQGRGRPGKDQGKDPTGWCHTDVDSSERTPRHRLDDKDRGNLERRLQRGHRVRVDTRRRRRQQLDRDQGIAGSRQRHHASTPDTARADNLLRGLRARHRHTVDSRTVVDTRPRRPRRDHTDQDTSPLAQPGEYHRADRPDTAQVDNAESQVALRQPGNHTAQVGTTLPRRRQPHMADSQLVAGSGSDPCPPCRHRNMDRVADTKHLVGPLRRALPLQTRMGQGSPIGSRTPFHPRLCAHSRRMDRCTVVAARAHSQVLAGYRPIHVAPGRATGTGATPTHPNGRRVDMAPVAG